MSWSVGLSSPRPRGWSGDAITDPDFGRVVPAPAGVVRIRVVESVAAPCRPRARGGGPSPSQSTYDRTGSSPRPRGWSGRRPGPGTAPLVVPAPAGVVLGGVGSTPVTFVVPAPAGVVRRMGWRNLQPARRPRARGGGPNDATSPARTVKSSPRPRGWSDEPPRLAGLEYVVPAPAGVVRNRHIRRDVDNGRPRARGGGPVLPTASALKVPSSPRPRGWSGHRLRAERRPDVVPAPAGVVRHGVFSPPSLGRRPRARGGGPRSPRTSRCSRKSSPRPRGWSAMMSL